MRTAKLGPSEMKQSDDELSATIHSIFIRTRNRVYGGPGPKRCYPKTLPSDRLREALNEYAPKDILKEIFPDEAYDANAVVERLRAYQTAVTDAGGTTPSTLASDTVSPEASDIDNHIDGQT